MTSDALHKTALVPQTVDEAFRIFTEDTSWWPLASHSVGGTNAIGVVFGHGVGAEIVETVNDGSTHVWGTITHWDPPSVIRFTWHPGTPVDEATDVEVRFSAVDTGTQVDLVHTGWDARPDGARFRAGYDTGWDFVFGRYAARADGALSARSEAIATDC